MEFFAESARALVLAESGPRDERPIPAIARRCRRAVAVMERVGDAFDDLEAISNQAGGIPMALVSEIFLPASASEHAEAGWVRYYWRTYFDVLASSQAICRRCLRCIGFFLTDCLWFTGGGLRVYGFGGG